MTVILINFMFQDVYEPPPLDVGSISLLQLSYEGEIPYKLERLYPKAHILEGPVVNLRCAVKILTKLVAQNKTVEFSEQDFCKGAARYWSVMRKGKGHYLEEVREKVKAAVSL
ncbi:hypothetical protein BZG29_17195 [Janthinobacterium sp. LM6]|uniref:hypothetical protein n=1 Tax=Janthinobacterium sp. LM6 TaxID=1938606 RepID=UPI000983E37E|nr:hypothetical protein [Janthinobacterium sp. LM6]AQR69868.1 hypothetical protein BZG29_17195 [Janthinobacterium sp. LM6]